MAAGGILFPETRPNLLQLDSRSNCPSPLPRPPRPLGTHYDITERKQAEAVGEILAAPNQTYQLNDVPYHNTPSIGATLFKGHDTAIEDLVKQADFAMYNDDASDDE